MPGVTLAWDRPDKLGSGVILDQFLEKGPVSRHGDT